MIYEHLTAEVIEDALAAGNFGQFPEVDIVLEKAGKTREDLKIIMTRSRVKIADRKALDGLRAQPWHLEGSESTKEILKPIVAKCWHKLCRAALNAELYGYSVMERVYLPDESGDRATGIKTLLEAPISRYKLDVDGKLFRRDPVTGQWEERDTLYKYLVAVNNPTADRPMGEATLSALFWPDFLREALLKFGVKACEKFERPTIAAESDESDPIKRQVVVNAMIQGLNHGAILLPRDSNAQILSKELKNPDLFMNFMEYFDREVFMLFLGHHMGAEITGQGARSAIDGGDAILQDLSESRALSMTPMVQNFCDAYTALAQIEPAEFVWSDIVQLNSDKAARDKTLYDQGVRLTKEYYSQEYNIEEKYIASVSGGTEGNSGGAGAWLSSADDSKKNSAARHSLINVWEMMSR